MEFKHESNKGHFTVGLGTHFAELLNFYTFHQTSELGTRSDKNQL